MLETSQYTWDGVYVKRIGGGFVGTSVEFDFSLFTLIWFLNNNGFPLPRLH